MKERILKILKEKGKSLTVFELEEELGTSNLEELLSILNEMEIETSIYHTNKDKYMLFEDSHLLKGYLHSNKKGFGFVDVDSLTEDVYISADNMNGAIHGDYVIVELTSKKDLGRLEGRIIRVLKHETNTFVGEINFYKNVGKVKLDEDKVNLEILISKENSLNAVDGHKVVVEIIKRISNHQAEGKVLRIIGHKNDPGVDILSIVEKYHINSSFPEDVVEEVKTLPMEVSEADMKGRRDLRDKVIFTIDGDDTRDIDDAVSIDKKENGNYLLGVHIAGDTFRAGAYQQLKEWSERTGAYATYVDPSTASDDSEDSTESTESENTQSSSSKKEDSVYTTNSIDSAVVDALNSLEEGQTSDMITTDSSYYFVRLDRKTDSDATESNRKTVKGNKDDKYYNGIISDWQDDEKWKVKENQLNKIDIHNYFTTKTKTTESSQTE